MRFPTLFAVLAVGAVCCCVVAGNVLSGAGFSSASSGAQSVHADPDWVDPTVGTAIVSKTLRGVPIGSPGFLQAGETYRVYANATDSNSGVAAMSADVSAITAGGGSVPLHAGSFTLGTQTYAWASDELTADAGLAEGIVPYAVTAVDHSDNASTDPSPTATVDNTAPTVTLTDPGTALGGTITLRASAKAAGSGVASVAFERSPAGQDEWTPICTDTGSPYTCSFDTTAVADGHYDLRAVATNGLANRAEDVATDRVVDNTAPTVSLDDPGSWLRGTVALAATAADAGSGVTSVAIQRTPAGQSTWTTICTDTGSPWTCPFATTGVADRAYDLRAVATDAAGNTATSAPVGDRTVDNTAPSSATVTNPGSPLRDTITLAGSATDALSGIATIDFQLSPSGGSAWSTACTPAPPATSCSFDTRTVADGLYDVRSVATDRAGNVRTSSTVTARRIDNTAPAIAMTDPGAALRGSVTLSATATDGGSGIASVRYQRSPAGQGAWTDVCTASASPFSCAFATTAVADGLYDLRAIATDAAGNVTTSPAVAARRVDNTPPTGVAVANPGSPLRGSLTLSGAASDAGSGIATLTFQIVPSGTTGWTTACVVSSPATTCPVDTTAAPDGLYDLRLIAADAAGNTTTSAVVAGRRVDNTPPAVTLTDPGAALHGSVNLGAGASDAGSGLASIALQVSPAGQAVWTNVCTVTTSPASCALATTSLADGSYDLRAVASDAAGNSAISALSGRLVDNTPPAVALADPGAWLRGTVSLTATADDGAGSGIASVTVQRAPTGQSTWTTACTVTAAPYTCALNTTTLADGSFDLRAVATDAAGNSTVSTVVADRRVDNTAPRGTSIDSANTGGGTQGIAEAGDTLTFGFSEAIDPGSILPGWTGAATPVTLRFTNANPADRVDVYDQANASPISLGTVKLGDKGYVTGNATFTATMAMSGSTITITLGTPSNASVFTRGASDRMTWTPSASATDPAGNPARTTAVSQSAAQRQF